MGSVGKSGARYLTLALLLFCPPSWSDDKTSGLVEKADRIVVEKSVRTMSLIRDGKVLKAYKVALGTQPIGAKERRGDHKTPEGLYVIDSKNARSRFHLALHVSYPNAADRARARKAGVDPGGAIMIHGLESKYAWLGSLHRNVDWTDGCIAVTNAEIEEIWRLIDIGTPVEIKP
jgi:murein L,D-transpeptidase YafK